jgi:hypothetical protein
MLQNMPSVRGSREERALSKIYKELDSNHRQTLLSFANFLVQQQKEQSATSQENIVDLKPLNIPRPKKESVIKAIRRLSANYPMIDTDTMFDAISKSMTSHIMEGRSAEEVINDLQALFENQYTELNNG